MQPLSPKLSLLIEQRVGLPFHQIQEMDFEKIDESIEKRIGKKLKPLFNHPAVYTMGTIFLYLKRVFSFKRLRRMV